MKVAGVKLAEVANKSETSKLVFKTWAKRQRIRHFMDLNRQHLLFVRAGHKIVESDYVETFESLQSLGLGRVIQGRIGSIIRFEFFTSLKNIAEHAIEGKDLEFIPNNLVKEIVTQDPPKEKRRPGRPRKEKRAAPVLIQEVGSNLLVVPLRNQFIRIEVPGNLNKQEAEMLSKALLSMTKAS